MLTPSAYIRESLETGEALETMAEVYSEIAVLRLNRVRSRIERNRQFVEKVAAIFACLRPFAPHRSGAQTEAKKPLLNVVLTSNWIFHGDLDRTLLRFFGEKGSSGDLAIVGQIGQNYLLSTEPQRPYRRCNFRQDLPTAGELTELVNLAQEYREIAVFYPQFQTLIVQKPVTVRLDTEGLAAAERMAPRERPQTDLYILEPEAGLMLSFLRRIVIRLFLEQAFLEAQLARTAARIVVMDEASRRAAEFIARQYSQLVRLHRQQEEKGMLEVTLGRLAHLRLPASLDASLGGQEVL